MRRPRSIFDDEFVCFYDSTMKRRAVATDNLIFTSPKELMQLAEWFERAARWMEAGKREEKK